MSYTQTAVAPQSCFLFVLFFTFLSFRLFSFSLLFSLFVHFFFALVFLWSCFIFPLVSHIVLSEFSRYFLTYFSLVNFFTFFCFFQLFTLSIFKKKTSFPFFTFLTLPFFGFLFNTAFISFFNLFQLFHLFHVFFLTLTFALFHCSHFLHLSTSLDFSHLVFFSLFHLFRESQRRRRTYYWCILLSTSVSTRMICGRTRQEGLLPIESLQCLSHAFRPSDVYQAQKRQR